VAARPADDRPMHSTRLVADLPRVYSAAFAASGDQTVAEHVAERVMLAAEGSDVSALVERAVLLAVRASPHRAFAPMCAEEREVVALARLAGATTQRVAALLGVEVDEVRARMSSGLRALARSFSADGARRTPPLRRDCGSAASRAHVAHVF
jgi:hypothetical protein